MIKLAYSVYFLLTRNIFVRQNVLYFSNDPLTSIPVVSLRAKVSNLTNESLYHAIEGLYPIEHKIETDIKSYRAVHYGQKKNWTEYLIL